MKKLLFVHVAKTAGTSVVTYLHKAYVGRERLALRHQDKTLDNVTEDQINKADFIWLHAPLNTLSSAVKPFFTFTILRDPVQRVKSTYYYLRNPEVINRQNFDHTPRDVVESLREIEHMTFKDFLQSENPHHQGHYTNMYASFFRTLQFKQPAQPTKIEPKRCYNYSNERQNDLTLEHSFAYLLENFDYIGLTQTLNQDIELVRKLCFEDYQEPFGNLRMNISKKKEGDTDIDEEVLEILEEKLYYDIPIYEYGCQLREQLFRKLTHCENSP